MDRCGFQVVPSTISLSFAFSGDWFRLVQEREASSGARTGGVILSQTFTQLVAFIDNLVQLVDKLSQRDVCDFIIILDLYDETYRFNHSQRSHRVQRALDERGNIKLGDIILLKFFIVIEVCEQIGPLSSHEILDFYDVWMALNLR